MANQNRTTAGIVRSERVDRNRETTKSENAAGGMGTSTCFPLGPVFLYFIRHQGCP